MTKPNYLESVNPDYSIAEPWAFDKLRHHPDKEIQKKLRAWPKNEEDVFRKIEFRNKMLDQIMDEPISQAEKDARTAREIALRKNWFDGEDFPQHEQDKLDEAVKKAEETK